MIKNNFSVIVFDLGMVLINFDYKIVLSKLEAVEKGLGEKFLGYYKNNYHIHRSFEKGEIEESSFIEKMLGVLDHKINAETFCGIYAKIFTVNEDVVSLLPELKKKHMLILLSNTDSLHQKYGWKDYEFLKHFDKLILSHEVGSVKPEEKIYAAVEAFTQKPPEEHLFIDDIKEYVEAAENRGWEGIQFVNFHLLVESLNEKGISFNNLIKT